MQIIKFLFALAVVIALVTLGDSACPALKKIGSVIKKLFKGSPVKSYNVWLPQLGQGACGTVYPAKHVKDGNTLYALKIVHFDSARKKTGEKNADLMDEATIRSLYQERNVSIRLNGAEWAIGLRAAFRIGASFIYVFDCAVGGSYYALHQKKFIGYIDPETQEITWISMGPLYGKFILAAAIEIVFLLHLLKIIHGDLHPGNFLMDINGRFLLSDFGAAIHLPSEAEANWQRYTNSDWNSMADYWAPYLSNDGDTVAMLAFMRVMTDSGIYELRELQYFKGVDWDQMAKRTYQPIHELLSVEMDIQNPAEYQNIPGNLYNKDLSARDWGKLNKNLEPLFSDFSYERSTVKAGK